MVFFGMLLDGELMLMIIPEQKRLRAVGMVESVKKNKKTAVLQLQQLCGFLNFLHKAIPGRAFTCCLYAKNSRLTDLSKVGYKYKCDPLLAITDK